MNEKKTPPSHLPTLCVDALLGIAAAYVVSTAWGWFVAPLGPPDVGVAHAYGLMLLVQLVVTGGNRPAGAATARAHPDTNLPGWTNVASRAFVLVFALAALAVAAWVMP